VSRSNQARSPDFLTFLTVPLSTPAWAWWFAVGRRIPIRSELFMSRSSTPVKLPRGPSLYYYLVTGHEIYVRLLIEASSHGADGKLLYIATGVTPGTDISYLARDYRLRDCQVTRKRRKNDENSAKSQRGHMALSGRGPPQARRSQRRLRGQVEPSVLSPRFLSDLRACGGESALFTSAFSARIADDSNSITLRLTLADFSLFLRRFFVTCR
jgi:hypothetical protein